MQTSFKNHLYQWSGQIAENQIISGEIAAFSPNLAKIKLQQQDIQVLSITRQYSHVFNFKKKFYAVTITHFFRQLATLINAGVPLLQSLTILLESHAEAPHFAGLMYSLKKELQSGKTFTNSLRAHQTYFDNLSCHLIAIAEQTGTLSLTLSRIADHKEKNHTLKNKLRQALFYPAIILLTALSTSALMLLVVIPKFAELFASFHAQLPSLTLAIIHCSAYLRKYFWLAIFPLLFFVFLKFYYHKSLALRIFIDKCLLHLPIIRHLISKFIFARFSRTLSTILAAGMPLDEGLNLMIDIVPSHTIKTAIGQTRQDIISGKALHNSMREQPIFPRLLIQMIKIGEESGALAQMLAKAAEWYETEMDNWVTHFSHLLEPLIIMILGVLIGILVIAMYLPIFKLGTVI